MDGTIVALELLDFRQARGHQGGVEHPRTAPFELRMRKGDGSWILTRWNLKRGIEGYRGVFIGIPWDARAEEPDHPFRKATPRFNFLVKILQQG